MLNQRKPQDEWGHVIKAQAEASRQQDIQQAKLNQLNKRRYRQQLERQLNQKRQQQIDQRMAYREHQNIVRQKQRAINDWNEKLRQQFYQQKKNLYNDQQEHAQQKFRETQANLFQSKAQEQQRLNFVQKQIEQQKQRELAQRTQKTNTQQEVLRTNELQKQYQRRADLQEKINNHQMNLQQIQRVNQRDQALRNHNRRKLEENELKTQAFQNVAAMNMQRDMSKQVLVSNWHQQHQQRLNQKEELEKKLKYDSLLNTNQILRAQLSEKEQQRQFARQQFQRERQESLQNANRVKEHQQALQFQKRKEMEQYKNTLLQQTQYSQQAKIDEFKFSQKEKQMHQDIIRNLEGGQNVQFRGVPGAHPRVSPLQNSFNRAYKSHAVLPSANRGSFAEAQKKFYGEEQNFFLDKKMQTTKSFEQAFDPNRHDPIVNPIGGAVPRGSPMVGGRALSLLHAGASITRPNQ